MRARLSHKLILGLISVVLLGGLSIVIMLNLSTKSRYFQFVERNDIAVAHNVAQMLELYYRGEGSWEGVSEILEGAGPGRGMAPGRMAQGGMNRAHGMLMSQLPVYSRIILTDTQGDVLADNGEDRFETLVPENAFAPGAQIRSGGTFVGLVYAGTMIEPRLHPVQRDFLRSLNRIVIVASALGLGLAFIIGALLQRQIIHPLTQLTQASGRIADGHYDTRVVVRSKDEIGELAKSFNGMASSMEDAVAWRKQIVADVAHELRTPLSLMQGRLEMMMEGVYTPSSEQIRQIHEETIRLGGLVAQIEELSRVEADQVFIDQSPESILSVARRAAEQHMELASERDVDLVVEDAAVPKIPVDIELFEQVFSNLISNALRHTPTGGRIKINASEDIEQREIIVSVCDTGPGIPQTDLERIFERFYRVDAARNRRSGGSGLGLAICREIVRKHGGRIWAERPESGGGLIRFSLPFHASLDNQRNS